MAIFRKKIESRSYATVAIEADDMNEAQKIYDEWCDENDAANMDQVTEILNYRAIDDEGWINTYDNWETYRSRHMADDFEIAKKDHEPHYDLIFTFVNHPEKQITYFNCRIDKVIQEIQEKNKEYFLKATGSLKREWIDDAKERGVNIIHFDLERRQ